MGVVAALRQGKVTDHVATVTNFVFLAAPVFVVGLLLKEFVAIPVNNHLNRIVFYTSGEQSPTLTGSFFQRLPDYAAHTALPTITLILVTYSSWAIYQRASILETLDADYVRLARAKGISAAPGPGAPRVPQRPDPGHHRDRPGLRRRARRCGHHRDRLRLAGAGTWFLNGVTTLDINITLAYLAVTAVFVILFNLLADVLYAFLDPRIRYD